MNKTTKSRIIEEMGKESPKTMRNAFHAVQTAFVTTKSGKVRITLLRRGA